MIQAVEPAHDAVMVELGDWACRAGGGTLVAVGLEASVAVVLHDSARHVGGLAHVGLPVRSLAREQDNPSRFVETAVPALLDRVVAEGASRKDVVARLVGGGTLFQDLAPAGAVPIGQRNVAGCRAMLHVLGVPIVGEATGGTVGRAVRLEVASGTVTVATAFGAEQRL